MRYLFFIAVCLMVGVGCSDEKVEESSPSLNAADLRSPVASKPSIVGKWEGFDLDKSLLSMVQTFNADGTAHIAVEMANGAKGSGPAKYVVSGDAISITPDSEHDGQQVAKWSISNNVLILQIDSGGETQTTRFRRLDSD